ncbi:MipA/OmpV family protein [Ancylobacter sp. A5.8]|uniref:MipA/OmpV family protein n=1 Tax=Ancylobacter gelatini TaxID=2919920 RepID=UPI001F4E357D|nr:MipA/OmpV family protein [Ancylobacter gelatini]MCJ8141336.1 MipA/OmpV family protein [Ancylobacter gelatini]
MAQAADMAAVEPMVVKAEPTLDRQWTLTLGAYLKVQPEFMGSDDYEFAASPIFSITRADRLSRFQSYMDRPSIALFDSGVFEAGITGAMVWKRDSSDSNKLLGLSSIDYAYEAGGYLQWYPMDWLRLRGEVVYGFGGYEGVVANFAADAIYFSDYFGGMTLSAGPRLTLASSGFVDTYFGITPEESALATALGNSLSPYEAGGGVYSVGFGGQIVKRFTPNITGKVFAEYEYLTGDAADSPLVVQNGDRNQFQAGVGLSYTFFLGFE